MNLPRLMIAAPTSGSGKTTFTCGLLRTLMEQGNTCVSWKCGPDYIDPMFHRESLGITCGGNLDLFLCSEARMTALLCRESHGADVAVIEGVMGYYDGLGGSSDIASSWDVARVTKTPVVLLVSAKGVSVSIAALINGFLRFREPSQIAAVVINHVSPMFYPTLKTLIEKECSIPVAGYLPPMADCAFGSRHLGLVTAAETENLSDTLDRLAAQVRETIDLTLLKKLAYGAPAIFVPPSISFERITVRVAVAYDKAFCFYYSETLSLLRDMGAELCFFSPISDAVLPEVDALLLGGGYPELHGTVLAKNSSMRESIRNAVLGGMPTIAECGGFLYLQASLKDHDGITHTMVGVFDGEGFPTTKLSRFGYATLTAYHDNLLCDAGETLPIHEFHYWDTTQNGEDFTAKKPLREITWDCAYVTDTLYAGFPHLYLAGNPKSAQRFLCAADLYKNTNRKYHNRRIQNESL